MNRFPDTITVFLTPCRDGATERHVDLPADYLTMPDAEVVERLVAPMVSMLLDERRKKVAASAA